MQTFICLLAAHPHTCCLCRGTSVYIPPCTSWQKSMKAFIGRLHLWVWLQSFLRLGCAVICCWGRVMEEPRASSLSQSGLTAPPGLRCPTLACHTAQNVHGGRVERGEVKTVWGEKTVNILNTVSWSQFSSYLWWDLSILLLLLIIYK